MSTTFEVYPRVSDLPTFRAITDISATQLHRFLCSIGIGARPGIHLRLQACKDNKHLPFSLDDPAKWDEDTYAWFMVGDLPGGTDAYFDADADAIREYLEGELSNPKCRKMEDAIHECASVGHRWWFRRSAGQPAVINLAYGLIAGSLAALTDGIIYSMDSAWDWQRMPAYPQDFLSWYFRPELALEENFREWSQRCIDSIAAELEGQPG